MTSETPLLAGKAFVARNVSAALTNHFEETGETQLGTLFHVAASLHSNFYENWLPQELVQSGLDSVTEMVDRLEQLLR